MLFLHRHPVEGLRQLPRWTFTMLILYDQLIITWEERMKNLHSLMIVISCLSWSSTYAADNSTALLQIKSELLALRLEYEARIGELEKRLILAELQVQQATDIAGRAITISEDVATAPGSNSPSALSDFNPSIGVALVGGYHDFGSVGTYSLPGFQLGEASGPSNDGLALGETEINFNANADDKFFANLTVALGLEDGEVAIELEEAYIQSLALPRQLTVTAGRFFSSVGYLNSFHSHSDEFVDRPIAYEVFLGGQYLDDGFKLSWLAPTAFYLEVGGELLRGNHFPSAGAANGQGAWTLFSKIGGDMGISTSWQAGVSYLSTDVVGRVSNISSGEFYGDSDLFGFDFVIKWAPLGNPRQRNFKLQGEYFSRDEKGVFDGSEYRGDQVGWYLQGIYQFRTGWQFGYRYDQLKADNTGVTDTELDPMGRDLYRNSIVMEWLNSEFSRVRLQYSRDKSAFDEDLLSLEYIINIGAHGAHRF